MYAIKKGRITLESLEKLVKKYYKTKEKQDRMLRLIHLKPDYLCPLPEMCVTFILGFITRYADYHGLRGAVIRRRYKLEQEALYGTPG